MFTQRCCLRASLGVGMGFGLFLVVLGAAGFFFMPALIEVFVEQVPSLNHCSDYTSTYSYYSHHSFKSFV